MFFLIWIFVKKMMRFIVINDGCSYSQKCLRKLWFLAIVLGCFSLKGQTPPTNPFLIDSPFPFVHQNNYRQGYSLMPALRNYESIDIRLATTPNERVSPWLLLSETYPDGSRTIWGCSSTHIWKAIANGEGLEIVSDARI